MWCHTFFKKHFVGLSTTAFSFKYIFTYQRLHCKPNNGEVRVSTVFPLLCLTFRCFGLCLFLCCSDRSRSCQSCGLCTLTPRTSVVLHCAVLCSVLLTQTHFNLVLCLGPRLIRWILLKCLSLFQVRMFGRTQRSCHTYSSRAASSTTSLRKTWVSRLCVTEQVHLYMCVCVSASLWTGAYHTWATFFKGFFAN